MLKESSFIWDIFYCKTLEVGLLELDQVDLIDKICSYIASAANRASFASNILS